MDINVSISPAAGITTNFLIAAVYEATSPSVVVAFQALPAPHSAPVNVAFTGLNPVVHIFILWENTTGVAGGTLRNTFIYDPAFSNSTLTVKADLVLIPTIGGGSVPTIGSTTFVDVADLQGWNYTVERRGTGTMIVGTDILINTTGGFTLLAVGDVFGASDIFIIHFLPQVNTISAIVPTNSGKIFSDAVVLTADTTLDTTSQGKVFVLQSLTNKIAITLPALSAVVDNRIIAILSEGGSQINASIIAAGSDVINFLNGTPQKVVMGQSEVLWLFKANSAWNVAQAQGNFKTVGEIVSSYKRIVEDCIHADGSLLSRTTYPRLWAWVQTLDATCLCSDSDWLNPVLNYQGRFSTGDGSTTFRIPDLTKQGIVRGVDGSVRLAASFQAGSLGQHSHGYNRTRTDTVGTRYEGNTLRAGGDRGLWTGDAVVTDLTGTGIGTETIPANIGVYLLIRI